VNTPTTKIVARGDKHADPRKVDFAVLADAVCHCDRRGVSGHGGKYSELANSRGWAKVSVRGLYTGDAEGAHRDATPIIALGLGLGLGLG
jgi:hypothetical protein